MNLHQLSDQQVLLEITQRVKQRRLNKNMTQQELAEKTGLHVQTIKNFESGKSTKLRTLIQILRVFDDLEALNQFLPDPGISPIQLLKLKGKERTRASGSKETPNTDAPW